MVRRTGTTKQMSHYTQKTNEDVSWKKVSDKKRNQNSSEMSTSRKQSKVNRYQLNKPMPTANFEGFEEKLDDMNINVKVEKAAKSPPIFARINNFSLLSQLLKEIVAGEYEIKIINEKTKIQSKNSIAYVNIVKELKNKNAELHTYKLK